MTSRVTEPMQLSVIVPVLNEASGIGELIAHLTPLQAAGAQVILVDGGSRDTTPAQVQAAGLTLIRAPRGRARQMNAGAAAATGELLLFLHADTRLPADALAQLTEALKQGARWGRFDVCIAGRSAWLTLIAAMMNLRSRLTGIATGDQAIFVHRDLFSALGGYAPIPLMEDVELTTRLRQASRPACLRTRVTTSGRRWEKHGIARTVLLMWSLRLRYFFGADPAQLALAYGYLPVADDV
ncbi:MAG: TIGR04283 family arsenosugar biosynthesis glycosyltransferase [Rhodocyclaceae bacterium]|jgi:rSAM/selenodomain-associated transferase 2|nr:TIGR04283 family arsenosugar biosynthesis glycosyltransferase [Rhodocyclaceae bacterium]